MRKFFDMIYDVFNTPDLSIVADYIELRKGFYIVNITLIGPEDMVFEKLTPQIIKEIEAYDLTSNVDIDVAADFEGLMEFDKLKKDRVRVFMSCRPGNMGKFISDKDFVDMIRESASRY